MGRTAEIKSVSMRSRSVSVSRYGFAGPVAAPPLEGQGGRARGKGREGFKKGEGGRGLSSLAMEMWRDLLPVTVVKLDSGQSGPFSPGVHFSVQSLNRSLCL